MVDRPTLEPIDPDVVHVIGAAGHLDHSHT